MYTPHEYGATNQLSRNSSFTSAVQFLVFVYIVAAPFYLFRSGLPQPADMVMAIAIALGGGVYVLQNRIQFSSLAVSFALFIGIITAVNLAHYFFIRDIRLALTPLMYIYNMGVFVLISILLSTDGLRTRRVLRYGIMTSIMVELAYVLLAGGASFREIGTFNNPNQLGYWALLSALSLYILHERRCFTVIDYGWLCLCLFLGAVSLSKATILTMPIVAALYFFSNKTSTVSRIVSICAVVFVLAGQGIISGGTGSLVQKAIDNVDVFAAVIDRIDTIGEENDDSLEGRGYLRIASHPEYLLIGAGEGGFDRFAPSYRYLEIHSSIATLLFSYGILGFGCFAFALYRVFRGARIDYWVAIGTVMSHGLVHQNIRFTTFWVFLAICYGTAKNRGEN